MFVPISSDEAFAAYAGVVVALLLLSIALLGHLLGFHIYLSKCLACAPWASGVFRFGSVWLIYQSIWFFLYMKLFVYPARQRFPSLSARWETRGNLCSYAWYPIIHAWAMSAYNGMLLGMFPGFQMVWRWHLLSGTVSESKLNGRLKFRMTNNVFIPFPSPSTASLLTVYIDVAQMPHPIQ